MRIKQEQHKEIAEAYNNNERMADIGKRYGVGRLRIWQILKRLGVDTSKRKIEATCAACGATLLRHRGYIRSRINVFCGHECYGLFCSANGPSSREPNKNKLRQGMRLGRATMQRYYGQLPAGSVVHHINGNNYDNRIDNLILFRSSGDHAKHHRNIEVTPLLDGRCYAMRPWPTLTRDNVIGAILLYFAR